MIEAEISDDEVAVMCDIARAARLDDNPGKRKIIARLLAEGWIATGEAEGAGHGSSYVVTRAGQQLLDERGVGVNES